MQELKVFENKMFGSIRALAIDGEPWFVGKDVSDRLGYSNNRKALFDHVDDEDKKGGVTIRDGIGREQKMTIINESGLYALILSSKLPAAKAFKRWVTHEVIPAIRKTGGYIASDENMTDAEIMARALLVAQSTIEKRDAKIAELESKVEEDKPKVLFASCVETASNSISVDQMAKVLRQNGYDTGRTRLFETLRQKRFLFRSNGQNVPTQRAMNMGLFELKETTRHSGGRTTVTLTPKVTGKGQVYFINYFLGGKVNGQKSFF